MHPPHTEAWWWQHCKERARGGKFFVNPVYICNLVPASLRSVRTKMFFLCVDAVADSSSNWAVCGKSSGMVLMPAKANATHKVQIEVMPLFAGHLPFPKIKVLKYLPHTAAPAPQPDPGKTLPHPKTLKCFTELRWNLHLYQSESSLLHVLSPQTLLSEHLVSS